MTKRQLIDYLDDRKQPVDRDLQDKRPTEEKIYTKAEVLRIVDRAYIDCESTFDMKGIIINILEGKR